MLISGACNLRLEELQTQSARNRTIDIDIL